MTWAYIQTYCSMPTISVYVPDDQNQQLGSLVEDGKFENKSRAVQHAVAETFGDADE